jgi:Tol biopolymer transport system component/DNA-binding winged helix-turn-helix (wHTH) protein
LAFIKHDSGSACSAIMGEFTTQKFHFGEFTLDQASYRLQRGDRLLRLEKLPMELLILLVQRQGELVLREEIAGHIWGGEVFLDVDHSINTAIRKIRQALRDNPEKPRFLETIIGKGYRFAAPVTCSNGSNPVNLDASTTTGPVPMVQEVSDAPDISTTSTIVSPLRIRTILNGTAVFAMTVVLAAAVVLWIRAKEYFWRNPVTGARFQTVTDWDGVEQAAAVSRDGHFLAFLSDRDGPMDVWITQIGSGQFHNLTHGSVLELANPSIRSLGFSPDGSLVTFWGRKPDPSGRTAISIWAVPTLGGEPRPYLEGVAEYDWSSDGEWLAYHTPGPGDPLSVSRGMAQMTGRHIFTAPAGLHSHFPLWSPDEKFIYFVQGSLPDKLDIWRIARDGGNPERITFHNSQVSYPVFLDRRTLMYLATDADGSGPGLYSIDVDHRIAHRLTQGLDRYTSLSATAEGRRFVVTLASPKTTLWRLRLDDSPKAVSEPSLISLTTTTGLSPRLGPNYLVYTSAAGASESIWKLAGAVPTELWRGNEARIFGGPAISADGRFIAFSVRQSGRTLLYVMDQDGSNARVVAGSLNLQGDPAWAPDGQSITTAAGDSSDPHLFRVPLNGHSPSELIRENSLDPIWAPEGDFVVFTGPDIGTSFSVNAANLDGSVHTLPRLSLTRGARHFAFLRGGHTLIVLRGEIQHKDLWLINLDSGAERQLTNLPSGFDIRDFDLSPDGHEVVLERVQDRSDIALLDLTR